MAERITITFETGNAAFENSPTEEIARILYGIADDLRDNGDTSEIIRDANGDTVGSVRIDSISREAGGLPHFDHQPMGNFVIGTPIRRRSQIHPSGMVIVRTPAGVRWWLQSGKPKMLSPENSIQFQGEKASARKKEKRVGRPSRRRGHKPFACKSLRVGGCLKPHGMGAGRASGGGSV